MDLRQYSRVLLAHWPVIAASVVVCTVGAGILALTRTPIYAAHSQLFVSNGIPANLSDSYVGSLFTQQRVVSYAEIVSSPTIAKNVIEQLDLPDTVQQLQDEVDVSEPSGTVLINLTVKDTSPQRAEEIADALGQHFATFVNTLETSQGEKRSPVKVTVTSPPELPTQPISPRKSLYLLLGILLGLVLGVGWAVLREAFHRQIHGEAEAEAVADAPVLGNLLKPSSDKQWLVALSEPASAQTEAYRRLRTNLGPLGPEGGLTSLLVSSAVDGERTTEVVANLGVVLAQAGRSVILVDANLRQPKLAKFMGLFAGGLSDVLRTGLSLEAALQSAGGELPLKVLGSGLPPRNPSELLGSPRFESVLAELTRLADVVVFDAPAVLEATDAAVLARLTSGVVLVTRAGATTVDQLEEAVRSLRAVDARLLGLVMHKSGRPGPPLLRHKRLGSLGVRVALGLSTPAKRES
jgi:polysaccharide biosynthesis transport protein